MCHDATTNKRALIAFPDTSKHHPIIGLRGILEVKMVTRTGLK